MKAHGWNAEWLEVGFSKTEAVALRRVLFYLTHDERHSVGGCDKPKEEPLFDDTIPVVKFKGQKMTEEQIVDLCLNNLYRMLDKVVNARTKTNGIDFSIVE